MLFPVDQYLHVPDEQISIKSRKKITNHSIPVKNKVLVKYETYKFLTRDSKKKKKLIQTEVIDLTKEMSKDDMDDDTKISEVIVAIYKNFNNTLKADESVRSVISIHRIEYAVNIKEIYQPFKGIL